MNKPLIVIPTYNNMKTLRNVAERALATGLTVLVVNDGSTDGGPETINDLDARRLDCPVNRGKGAAILAAAEWADANDFSHIITIDADGQHFPEESSRFVEKINESPSAIIVGNRLFPENDVPSSSRFGRKWSNMWFRIASGHSLPDSQSGFRAYPVAALRRVKCYGRRYDFEVEIMVRAAWAGLEVKSVDVSVHYSRETREASHFSPLWDNMRISRAYTRLVTRNFIPWPHKIIFEDEYNGRPDRLSMSEPRRSLKVLLKENTSPREVAFASMLGIFLGTLPLIAVHTVAIFFAATRLRLNRLIAVNISHLCAPPVVPALAIEAGYYMRNGEFLTEMTFQTLGREAHQRLLEYLLGSLLLGPVLAVCIGAFMYLAAVVFRRSYPARA